MERFPPELYVTRQYAATRNLTAGTYYATRRDRWSFYRHWRIRFLITFKVGSIWIDLDLVTNKSAQSSPSVRGRIRLDCHKRRKSDFELALHLVLDYFLTKFSAATGGRYSSSVTHVVVYGCRFYCWERCGEFSMTWMVPCCGLLLLWCASGGQRGLPSLALDTLQTHKCRGWTPERGRTGTATPCHLYEIGEAAIFFFPGGGDPSCNLPLTHVTCHFRKSKPRRRGSICLLGVLRPATTEPA